MRLLGKLLACAVPVIVGRAATAAWVYGAIFPLGPGQEAALRATLVAALVGETIAVAGVLTWLARRIDAALGARAPGEDGEPGAVAAVRAVHRLPLQLAALLAVGALATGVAVVAALDARGLPADLAAAAGTVALAVGALGALIGHALAAVVRSEAVERLGTRAEVAARGTVRGKILALGFGLNTSAVLLFGAAGYVRWHADLRSLLSLAVLVYAATALLAWVAARAITAPFRTLGRAADLIAAGDLTVSPATVSRDEIGTLAADFRRMAQGLKALVSQVQGASRGVSLGAREAAAIGEQVRAGAAHGHEGVRSVQAAVEAMERSVLQVSGGVGGLSEYVAATNRAMAEMAAAFDDVSRRGIELERAIEAAVREVDQLGDAGREAESRLGHLDALSAHAGTALAAVKESMSGLERAAAESGATAEQVAEMAERAGKVVEETAHGIESLRAAVADAHRRVEVLGRRSDDIDQVVDFISEVAGRTNLLSLNASIIAAQAGEHGKPFGVVADQIRELAAQIARSTKSIADIVRAVRDDVEGTAALIDRGDALAGAGVQLARKSLEALSQIQHSTGHARDTAVAIRMAVSAHAQSSTDVARVFDAMGEGARAATGAVQLVGRSVAAVNSVSRGVDAMADQVARALQDQAGLGRRQIDSLRRLEQMIADIGRAVEAHDAATRRVREALQALTATAGEHETAVEGLASVADRLGSGAKALAERVDRFRV